ncbi:sugar nucleotidyltransferase (plasmid) [Haloferax larsenii]|uniref:Sugar nucleotidyltransferase n=1 Tax=Haloferax larsenii TaxID=302484 RepID=A0ABY5RJ76_HALLR|nr:sugar nucleotidyltransferase [Haloferax larsenii]UVE52422.1 sugar nucleotidyltransferase [Haloferax larsenii]
MQAVLLAAGKGTRLRPLTDDRPKALVEVDGVPLVERCLDHLRALGASEVTLVVGYLKAQVIERLGDEYHGIQLTYTHQREQKGLAHALLTAEPHVDGDFMLMFCDNVFRANLADVVETQREQGVDAALLVESVSYEEASRHGVCTTNERGELVDIVEKPDDPQSTLVTTGFYTFSPAIFRACRLVQPSDRGEYELPDAIALLVRAGMRVETVELEGWRIDVGYPDDRDEAERRLRAEAGASDSALDPEDGVSRS